MPRDGVRVATAARQEGRTLGCEEDSGVLARSSDEAVFFNRLAITAYLHWNLMSSALGEFSR